jgi:hypothetical protein
MENFTFNLVVMKNEVLHMKTLSVITNHKFINEPSALIRQLPHRSLIHKIKGGFNIKVLKTSVSLIFALSIVNAVWFMPLAFAEPNASTHMFTKKHTNVFGPSIPIDDPTFCFGENNLGRCVLFFGSANSCNNINPCISSEPSTQAISRTVAKKVISRDDLTFCYGQDDLTGQCTLFAGPKSACESLEPCSVPFKRLN